MTREVHNPLPSELGTSTAILGRSSPGATVHRVDERGRAVKVFAPAPTPDDLRRARETAEAIAAISDGAVRGDPGLVQTDVRTFDGRLVLDMAYIDAPLLDEVEVEVEVRQRTHAGWRPALAALTGLELALSLQRLHDAKLVHGDVSAGNVRKDRDGRPILIDLHVPLPRRPGRQGSSDTINGVAATAGFDAPEIRKSSYTQPLPPADVYGLCALVYLLVMAKLPWQDEPHTSAPEARHRRDAGAPLDLPHHRLGVALGNALRAGLQSDAQARPRADELATLFARVPSVGAPRPRWVPPPMVDRATVVPTPRPGPHRPARPAVSAATRRRDLRAQRFDDAGIRVGPPPPDERKARTSALEEAARSVAAVGAWTNAGHLHLALARHLWGGGDRDAARRHLAEALACFDRSADQVGSDQATIQGIHWDLRDAGRSLRPMAPETRAALEPMVARRGWVGAWAAALVALHGGNEPPDPSLRSRATSAHRRARTSIPRDAALVIIDVLHVDAIASLHAATPAGRWAEEAKATSTARGWFDTAQDLVATACEEDDLQAARQRAGYLACDLASGLAGDSSRLGQALAADPWSAVETFAADDDLRVIVLLQLARARALVEDLDAAEQALAAVDGDALVRRSAWRSSRERLHARAAAEVELLRTTARRHPPGESGGHQVKATDPDPVAQLVSARRSGRVRSSTAVRAVLSDGIHEARPQALRFEQARLTSAVLQWELERRRDDVRWQADLDGVPWRAVLKSKWLRRNWPVLASSVLRAVAELDPRQTTRLGPLDLSSPKEGLATWHAIEISTVAAMGPDDTADQGDLGAVEVVRPRVAAHVHRARADRQGAAGDLGGALQHLHRAAELESPFDDATAVATLHRYVRTAWTIDPQDPGPLPLAHVLRDRQRDDPAGRAAALGIVEHTLACAADVSRASADLVRAAEPGQAELLSRWGAVRALVRARSGEPHDDPPGFGLSGVVLQDPECQASLLAWARTTLAWCDLHDAPTVRARVRGTLETLTPHLHHPHPTVAADGWERAAFRAEHTRLLEGIAAGSEPDKAARSVRLLQHDLPVGVWARHSVAVADVLRREDMGPAALEIVDAAIAALDAAPTGAAAAADRALAHRVRFDLLDRRTEVPTVPGRPRAEVPDGLVGAGLRSLSWTRRHIEAAGSARRARDDHEVAAVRSRLLEVMAEPEPEVAAGLIELTRLQGMHGGTLAGGSDDGRAEARAAHRAIVAEATRLAGSRPWIWWATWVRSGVVHSAIVSGQGHTSPSTVVGRHHVDVDGLLSRLARAIPEPGVPTAELCARPSRDSAGLLADLAALVPPHLGDHLGPAGRDRSERPLLFLAPDPQLRRVPFALLPFGQGPLVASCTPWWAPPVSDMRLAGEHPGGRPDEARSLAVFGVGRPPWAEGGWLPIRVRRLFVSEDLVTDVPRTYELPWWVTGPDPILTGLEALHDGDAEEPTTGRFLAVVAHSSPTRPPTGIRSAAARLAPSADGDRRGGPALVGPDLAYLSVCDGLGSTEGGVWDGLGPMLLLHGTGAVVTTSWPVVESFEEEPTELPPDGPRRVDERVWSRLVSGVDAGTHPADALASVMEELVEEWTEGIDGALPPLLWGSLGVLSARPVDHWRDLDG